MPVSASDSVVPFIGFQLIFSLHSHLLPCLFPASPPKVTTLDGVMASARDLVNLNLAHEIIMNNSFHVEQPNLPQNRYLKLNVSVGVSGLQLLE